MANNERGDRMSKNFGKLVLLFTVVPFIELFLLLKLAEVTSSGFTFGVIILTGLLGAFFARQQGKKVIDSLQKEMNLGRLPGDNLIHGLCVLIGGVLLLTPGLLTDFSGFMLLIPGTRHMIVKVLKQQFSGIVQKQAVHIYSQNVHIEPDYQPWDEQ
ncbi:FxsA family protein [Fusibacter sp. A1]|nr:FxsA family protein [Fusibacter sp. A1]